MRNRFNSNAGPPFRKRRGFSLIELMVAVTIIGVMAAIAVPSYRYALIQARADIAAANLRAIWAAERLYWLEYHTYTDKLDHQEGTNDGLVDFDLLDPMIFQSRFYEYAPASTASNTAFSVSAANTLDGITITIDQTGTLQTSDITLGFQ